MSLSNKGTEPSSAVHLILMGSGLHELTITEPVARVIFDEAASHERTLACCLLPDRLEWLLRSEVSADTAIEALRARSRQVVRRLGIEEPLWADGCADDLSVAKLPIREEAVEEAVQKMMELPVREGHVQDLGDWPYWSTR